MENHRAEKDIIDQMHNERASIKGLERVFRAHRNIILNNKRLKREITHKVLAFKDSNKDEVIDSFLDLQEMIGFEVEGDEIDLGADLPENREANKAIVVSDKDSEELETLPSTKKRNIQWVKEETGASRVINSLVNGIETLTSDPKKMEAKDLMAAAQAAQAINSTVNTTLKIAEYLDAKKKR